MPGEVFVNNPISDCGAIILAIWQIFQNDRNRVLFRIDRQPDASGQAGTVGKHDPGVFDRFHRMGQVSYRFEVGEFIHFSDKTKAKLDTRSLLIVLYRPVSFSAWSLLDCFFFAQEDEASPNDLVALIEVADDSVLLADIFYCIVLTTRKFFGSEY